MHPVDMIFFWARSNPEHPALIQSDMVVTYRELAEAIELVSGRVAHYGFSKQEPVAVSIQQPIQKLTVCFALMRHGISAAPVSRAALPHLRSNGIYNVIFTGEGLMLSGGRNIRFEESWLKREANTPIARLFARDSRVGKATTIFLHSAAAGSLTKTIVPSGALMARIGMLPLIGEVNYDRALILPSLNSPAGFCRAAVNLYAGRTACFAGNDAAQLLAINTFNIDTLVCSPQHADELIEFAGKSGAYRLDSLREVWIEDGYLSKELGRTIQTRLCRNVIAGYGSAESGRIALANFDMISDVPEAVGFVVPHATVQIVDDNDAPLPPGAVGRVRCRTEFYSQLQTAAGSGSSAFNDPWWDSGDLGRLGNDGMLSIIAREQT